MTPELAVCPGPLGPGHVGATSTDWSASMSNVTAVRTPTRRRSSAQLAMQLGLSAAIVIASWITTRPLGVSGLAGLRTVLLLANSLLILVRNTPVGLLSYRVERRILIAWAVMAAGLLAVGSLGVASAFAYTVAGHAGYRLTRRDGIAVAVLVGVLSAVGLRIGALYGIAGWPWLLGLTVTLPVALGMVNRSRDVAMTSATEAVLATRRAAEAEAEARAMAERARISRDVHDVLAHSLSGINMQLQLSEMLLDSGDVERARAAIATASSIVRDGMAETRRAVAASRAEVLPLPQTLDSLLSPDVRLLITGTVRDLPTEASQTLIRVAQESLTNVRRHARGAEVSAKLTYAEASVGFELTNGPSVGTAPAAASEGSGMGLVGMRERVALLAGQIEVGVITDGPLAGGWRVAVTLPV